MRGGEAGQYSPGASFALMQIGPYSAFLYTVFHSVFYNSVVHEAGIFLTESFLSKTIRLPISVHTEVDIE